MVSATIAAGAKHYKTADGRGRVCKCWGVFKEALTQKEGLEEG